MKRTAIYMRVSTEKQVQEGDSISAQRDALMNYIRTHKDMVFAGEYLDDGVSGTKYDRDELQRMISDIKDKKIDLVICTKMDRLHRSLKNFLDMQDILNKHGCNWLAIWEPMYDSSTPQGRMIINTMMNLAQFEAEQTSQRIKQVVNYKISQGEVVSGNVPLGYKIQDKHLVPTELARYVVDIFNKYAFTGSLMQTTRFSSTIPGFPTTYQGVRYLLKNRKYTGHFRGNENYCIPIIDESLFNDVQRKLGMNIKSSQRRTYIFSGILRCGVCGGRMSGSIRYDNERGRTKIRYRCIHFYSPARTCGNSHSIMESSLEKRLLAQLKPWISDFVVECEKKKEPTKTTKAQIDSVTHKMDRLKELFINDMITLDEYKVEKESYEKVLAELRKEELPKSVDLSAVKAFLSMDIDSYYADLTNEEKRFFWRSIFNKLYFNDDKTISPEFLS